MVAQLISLFEDKISSLSWVERYGGLSRIFSRQLEDSVEVFPISYNTNPASCSEEKLRALIPDSDYLSLVYFEQISDVDTSRRNLSRKRSLVNYSVQMRFIAWINLYAIGIQNTNDSSYLLFPSFAKVMKEKVVIPENHELKDMIKIEPKVSNITLESKDTTKSSVFDQYSFSEEAAMFFPYDYFSATFQIDWTMNENCLSEIDINPVDCIKL